MADAIDHDEMMRARAAYFANVSYLDEVIGDLLLRLDADGLLDNTIIVYTTDHGEMAGEHGGWWKSNYYEGSVGVPLIARLPGRVPAGAAHDVVCNLMDLGPTILDLIGALPMPTTVPTATPVLATAAKKQS